MSNETIQIKLGDFDRSKVDLSKGQFTGNAFEVEKIVQNVLSNPLPMLADNFTVTSIKRDARSFNLVRTTYSREPELVYTLDHIDDILWLYPVI